LSASTWQLVSAGVTGVVGGGVDAVDELSSLPPHEMINRVLATAVANASCVFLRCNTGFFLRNYKKKTKSVPLPRWWLNQGGIKECSAKKGETEDSRYGEKRLSKSVSAMMRWGLVFV